MLCPGNGPRVVWSSTAVSASSEWSREGSRLISITISQFHYQKLRSRSNQRPPARPRLFHHGPLVFFVSTPFPPQDDVPHPLGLGCRAVPALARNSLSNHGPSSLRLCVLVVRPRGRPARPGGAGMEQVRGSQDPDHEGGFVWACPSTTLRRKSQGFAR